MKASLCSFLSIFISLSNTYGQKGITDSTKVFYGPPVVVTGTHEVMSDRFVPASISVVTSNDLKSSGQISLLDAISEDVPGVFVARRGVLGYGINGQAGTISIRGFGGNPNTQVLVMLDGVPQFMGLFGHPLPDSYLSEDADRVEVLRGPAGVLYGTNAMGGVINIITRKSRHKSMSVRAAATYGSFNTQEYSAGAGYRNDEFDILVSGDRDLTDGHRPNSSFSTGSGYINTGYTFDGNFAVRLNGIVNKFRTYDPGTVYLPLADNWVDVFRTTTGLSFTNTFTKTDGSFKLYFSYGEHDVFDGFHSLDRNMGALLYQNYHVCEASIITIGGDLRGYGGNALNDISGSDFGRHYVSELGIYGLVEQLFFRRLMLNAGARIEHSNIYNGEFVPQAGVAWIASANTTVKGSVAKGFRSPTIRELYLFPAPNPDLRPERVWNYEVGVLQSFGGSGSLQLTAFVARGSNLILTEGTYPNLQLLNSGGFTHKGVELEGRYMILENLRLVASYGYVDPGEQTYSTPKHKLSAGINYRMKQLSINLRSEHIAGLFGADYSRKKLPDYTVVGTHVSYEVGRFVRLYVSGDNLLNSSYQTIYGYPMPGRTLFAGINLRVENEDGGGT